MAANDRQLRHKEHQTIQGLLIYLAIYLYCGIHTYWGLLRLYTR
jgi:hypothetical protein